ncbi:MAG: hypothetical protein IKK70_02415 [Clostridia bacterium]|nr:hypothetical protein [Clostridia bacterium]
MKKKGLSLLLCIVMLLVSLASCKEEANESPDASGIDSTVESGDASESVASEAELVFDTTPRSIDFTTHYFYAYFKYYENDNYEELAKSHVITRDEGVSKLSTIVLESEEDVSKLAEEFENRESFDEMISKLPEGFFDEKLLLVNDFTAGCLGYDRAVRNVRVDENGVTVEFIYACPEVGDTMVDSLFTAIEIDKRDVYGHEDFSAESRQVSFDTTERDIDFVSCDFVGTLDFKYVSMQPNGVYMKTVTNEGYLNRLAEESGSDDFVEFASEKDEGYFREKTIILSYIPASSSKHVFNVVGVSCGEYGTAVKITRELKEEDGTATNRIIVTEVDFEEIFGTQPIFPAISDGSEWSQIQKGKLYFDGELIEDAVCEFDTLKREVMIPIAATLKGMGADVNWSSETKATISIDGFNYTLDLKQKIVRRAGEDRLWGDEERRAVRDKELMGSSSDLFGLLVIDLNYDLSSDFSSLAVNVKTRDY